MRKLRVLAPLCLAVFTLLAAARASAQTYVWTDERGVVHAASEPSEVPERFRAKAVHDAQRPRSNVNVMPAPGSESEPEAPAAATDDPTAPAPMKGGGHKPPHTEPPAAAPKAAPQAAAPADEPPPQPASDDDAPKKKGLPDPQPGFEWSCTADPEGGKPKCEQFEKRSSKRARHAAARAQARKQLGVEPGDENDPAVRDRVNERAQKEYERTTQKPPAPTQGDAEDSEESED